MVTILTHNGSYHADDVFAVAILSLLHPNPTIQRTRDTDLIAQADFVVDVGFEYDHEKKRYDHHQPEFTLTRENGLAYSACGLIWKHYGLELTNSEDITKILDDKLFSGIDAIDNGIGYPENEYGTRPYGISSILECFQPTFIEENKMDDAFLEAVELAQRILKREIAIQQAQQQAQQIVREALTQQQEHDYLILDTFCPWKKIVVDESDKKFVIFGRSDGAWAIQTVPVEKGSFASRQLLPEKWAGLQGEELSTLTGIPDCIFCHKARFIAAAKTKEGALALAQLALNMKE